MNQHLFHTLYDLFHVLALDSDMREILDAIARDAAENNPGRKFVEVHKKTGTEFVEICIHCGKETVHPGPICSECRNKEAETSWMASRGFVSVCPCTMLQVTTNVDGANSTKPLLPAGRIISRKLIK